MTTATLNDVSRWAEEESFFVLFAGAAKSAGRKVVTRLFFGAGAMVLAQFYTPRLLRFIEALNKRLPDVTEQQDLEMIRDILKLTYAAGRFYRKYCLFRGKADEALLEASETIDSLDFVLSNKNELEEFVAECEAKRVPELPFPHARSAVG